MLKETETEETRFFLPHFYHWLHIDWGMGAPPPPPPPGYAYASD